MILPDRASALRVLEWWQELTPADAERLVHDLPERICNLNGIPIAVRDRANRRRLPAELAAAERAVDQARTSARSATKPDRVSPALWLAEKRLSELAEIDTVINAAGVPRGAERTLIELDTRSNPRQVLAAVGIGDVDAARRVGVAVGGVDTTPRSLGGMAKEGTAIHQQAVRIGRAATEPDEPEAVALVAWTGYEAPARDEWCVVASGGRARAGAIPLNRFYRALTVTSARNRPVLNAFGHSYGSVVTSLALQRGGHGVTNAVFYGSPGIRLTSIDDLHLAPGGRAFYEAAANDATVKGAHWLHGVTLGDFGHGRHPGSIAGFVHLSAAAGVDPLGVARDAAIDHADYARVVDGKPHEAELRMSGYNFAAVLAGATGLGPAGISPFVLG